MLKDPKHPMTPGYITDDVFRCIRRCISNYFILAKPVTTRNSLDDNQEKAGDYWKDSWQLGKTAPGAARVGSPNRFLREEEPPSKLQIDSWKYTPRGAREGGRMRTPT